MTRPRGHVPGSYHVDVDTTDATRRQPLLVTSSPEQAESWAAVLDNAGLDALIEITDAQTGDPGQSPLIGAIGMRPLEFVNAITIPPGQRDQAIAALLDAGWDGREGLRGGRQSLGPDRPGGVGRQRTALILLASAGGAIAFLLLRTVGS